MIRNMLVAILFCATLVHGQALDSVPGIGQKAPPLLFVYNCGTDRGVRLLDPEGIRGSRCSPRLSRLTVLLLPSSGHDFVENADRFDSLGAQVLLVYPGPPDELDQRAKEFLSKENPLPANVIFVIDPDYKFTNQYGLRWDARNETAYPSTFLIDRHDIPHLDHGYAMTSHSSQGQTAQRVLIHVDTELAAKELLNSRMAYVAVSRGAEDAQLYTNDRAKLPEALGHNVFQESAHMPAMKPEKAITPQQEIAPVIEHDFGMGDSL